MSIKQSAAGDTIIEVLLSATALALVLSVSFASANRSLRVGSEAASRNQAVQYASQQIELIRLGLNSGDLVTTGAGANIPGSNFCVQMNTAKKVVPNNTTPCPGDCVQQVSPDTCDPADTSANDFGLIDTYDSARQTFTITTKWESSLTGNSNQVVMYYQDPQ